MTTIANRLGIDPVAGDVGVEIEVEGPHEFGGHVRGWRREHDGSLRGNSAEYVTSGVVSLEELETRLERLKAFFANNNTPIRYSMRAGVHVHVNCNSLTEKQVGVFALLYYILEEPLLEWCGEDRNGNMFCLSSSQGEWVVRQICDWFRGGNILDNIADRDDIRYAALNWCALRKFGSMEFRSLPTMPELNNIMPWASLLVHLREEACKIKDIRSIAEEFSAGGGVEWARNVLGPFFYLIKDTPDLERKLREGWWLVQEFCYILADMEGGAKEKKMAEKRHPEAEEFLRQMVLNPQPMPRWPEHRLPYLDDDL